MFKSNYRSIQNGLVFIQRALSNLPIGRNNLAQSQGKPCADLPTIPCSSGTSPKDTGKIQPRRFLAVLGCLGRGSTPPPLHSGFGGKGRKHLLGLWSGILLKVRVAQTLCRGGARGRIQRQERGEQGEAGVGEVGKFRPGEEWWWRSGR